jgi:hypothetical protein
MKTIFNEVDRKEISRRVASLRPDAQRQWGKMTVDKMLAHIADGLRSAVGELPVKPKNTPLRFAPARYLVLYWLPFPKGAPTAPELIERQPESIEEELRAVQELLEKFAAKDPQAQWPEHAAFGKMSGQDWGVLQYRHLDHHLRQFNA